MSKNFEGLIVLGNTIMKSLSGAARHPNPPEPRARSSGCRPPPETLLPPGGAWRRTAPRAGCVLHVRRNPGVRCGGGAGRCDSPAVRRCWPLYKRR
eukprot:425351-Prymnesium_polylepis.2